MKRPAAILLLIALAGAADAAEPAPPTNAVAECRTAALQLGRGLRERLEKALREGAPVDAISVCQQEAPALGRQVSGQTGLRVGRTALRVRNPDHAPDAWERGVLEQWSKLPAGTDLTKLETSAFVTGPDGVQELRYMKAIPTEALCLACHGEPIEPTLSVRIRSLYPTDQATGFRNGELRGALTVRKAMTSTKQGEQP